MFALGLQGSPRKKGNTGYLLSLFMDELEKSGAETDTVHVAGKNITPCRGCGYCEKNGYCVIEDDDMKKHLYSDLRRADIIVSATPVFFYSATAQLKGLIDRSQALWARRYTMKLDDPRKNSRAGFMLALGATKGANLFEGLKLTNKYFFDALGAEFRGSLVYRRIESAGDMKKCAGLEKDVKDAVKNLMAPFVNRKKVLFSCRENACRSQMAGAFAQYHAGDKMEVMTGGDEPADEINPMMAEVMAEKGIDMAFRKPSSIQESISKTPPERIITMGCDGKCPIVPGATEEIWDVDDPSGKSMDVMRHTRDEIEKRVFDLAKTL